MVAGSSAFCGSWTIIEMDLWDVEGPDSPEWSHLVIDERGLGALYFAAVEAQIDCRFVERDGKPAVEFTWLGFDDTQESCGRGWATLVSADEMTGRIFIHQGDDSGFNARRQRVPGIRKKSEGAA